MRKNQIYSKKKNWRLYVDEFKNSPIWTPNIFIHMMISEKTLTFGSRVNFGILEPAWKESYHQVIQKLWIDFEEGW